MKQNFNKYIILLLSIFTFWLWGIPFLLTKAVPIICENLSYNTEYNITVRKPRVYLNVIPNIIVEADAININSKNNANKLYVEKFKLNLRILPLLSGRVHINQIKAALINSDLLLDKKAELNGSFISNLINTKVICNSVDIEYIRLGIKQKDLEKRAEYLVKSLIYKKNGSYLKLYANSEINVNKSISKADIKVYLPKNNDLNKSIIDINISNFNIEPITEYLKNYLPADLISAAGIIDIKITKNHLNAVFKNLSIIKKDDIKSIRFPKELIINSGLNLTRKVLAIKNAQIKADGIDVIADGEISNYIDTPKSELDLSFRLNKSKTETFIEMLPIFKTEDIDSYKLKKYKFYGDVLGNFSVKGDIVEPSINGSIYIDNGILTKPIPNAKGATIKLDFTGKYLNYDVTVPAGVSEKVWVKGGVELYNVKYADMRVWSTQNVDLAIAESKVIPLHEILNFVIGPVPLMDIKGVGNIDITIKGNRKNPHVWGVFNLKNVTTYFYQMPDLVLTKADAKLTFDDENAVFNLSKGKIDQNSVNIDGTCTLSGKFDFDVKTEKQHLQYMYNAIKTSTMIEEIKNLIPSLDNIKGFVNLETKVYGNIKDIQYTKFNENFFVKGRLELLENYIELQGIKVDRAKGLIIFDNTNAKLDIQALIGKAPIVVNAILKDKIADAKVYIKNLNLKNIIPANDKLGQEIANIFVNVDAKYKGKADVIEYDKVDFDAQILSVAKHNKLKLSNGSIRLKNDKLQIKNISGYFEGTKSHFNINLIIDNLTTKPIFNGSVRLKDFELSIINSFGNYVVIPAGIRDVIRQVHFDKGKINADAKLSDNNVNTSFNVGGIEFTYTPLQLPIKVVNGSIYLRRNYLGINKLNLIADDMPILFDGGISNLFVNPDFHININLKPIQEFVDKYINNNRIYPIKVKGDIVYWLRLKGTKDNYNVKSQANISKDSWIYYLGATVGDVENSIILNLDMNVLQQNILKVREFSYDKIIDSQGKRRTRLNMLKAGGDIDVVKNDFVFKDFKVKTSNPTDARIFNILFRKPNIKQGQFTSDLKINGKLSNPHLTGIFRIVETNIPFMDIMMKTMSFKFRDRFVELSSKGEVLGNDVEFNGVLQNKLIPPYYVDSAELYAKALDLNYVTDRLKTAQVDDVNTFDSIANFDVKNAVIKNLNLKSDEVKLRNLIAKNVQASVALTDKKVININNFKFDMAEGIIDGKFSYNLLNNSTWIHLNTKKINANDMAVALFNLNNHIYGDVTGNVKLSCDGEDFDKCMQTLNGSVMFDVTDGKMPKLGSLEYLLRASNLLKGGLTSLSINSVIDILTPLKTGEFAEIYGTMDIKDGVSNNIEISTKGNNLSLFITGSYNFGNSNAQMEVLGLLSKKISTMFGPLGNVSMNTLFNIVPGVNLEKDSKLLDKINKIPGIELNSKAFRKFIAEINGNINGDNYVKSFSWIN